MTEHAPGPWHVEGLDVWSNDRKIMESPSGVLVELEANVRFIATAPDMFTLLLNLVVDGDIALATRMVISATLAKARGE